MTTLTCIRCKRDRDQKYMHSGWSDHDYGWMCDAQTSCRMAKRARAMAIRNLSYPTDTVHSTTNPEGN